MFKKVILPLQLWLLGQGRCVGCGKQLSDAVHSKKGSLNLVTCECRRIYVKTGDSYRRALLEEVQR